MRAPAGAGPLAERGPWIAALVLVVGAIAAHLPAFDAGFIWDDQYYLTDNLMMGSVDGLRRAWLEIGSAEQYYPMIHTSFWVEYRLWGMSPRGYHVTNVLIHVANALLLWRLLVRLAVPGAWLGAAIFAVHPVGVETVAWIAERKNLLSTFFYLAAALAYFRYEPPETSVRRPEDGRWHSVAFVLFLCALFSKTVAFSLPAAILVVYWWKRGRIGWESIQPLGIFFAAGIALGALTAWMEKFVVGAAGPSWDFSIVDRLLIAGRAVWFYAGKLVWPHPLAFSYPRWEIDASAGWQYLFPLAAIAALAGAWALRRRIGRAPLAAMLFFGGTLVPALGFFDVFPFVYSFVADHFQYLASVGPIALFAGAATTGARRLPSPLFGRLGAAALLATLGALTFRQATIYETPVRLWTDVIAKNPASILAHNNIASTYTEDGEYEKAVWHFREVLRIDPDDDLAHLNLGIVLERQGRTREAIRHLQIQIERFDDDYRAHARLGALFEREGRLAEAIHHYEGALRHGPPDPRAEARLRSLRARRARSGVR